MKSDDDMRRENTGDGTVPFRAFSEIIPGDKILLPSGEDGKVLYKFSTADSSIDFCLNSVGLGRTDLLFLGADDVSCTDMIVYVDERGKRGCYAYGKTGIISP